MNFGIAVKAFILQDNKVLLLKRRPNDDHKPATWDIPGGRLEPGEDPFIGIKRETQEETNLDIEVIMPLAINHFTRDDGQKITMIIFLCKPTSHKIQLSEEHTHYKWLLIEKTNQFPNWLHEALTNINRIHLA